MTVPRIKAGVRWVSWGRRTGDYIPGYAGEALLSVPAEPNAFVGFLGDWIKGLNVRIDGMPDLPFWGVESVHWASADAPGHLVLAHRAVELLESTLEIGLCLREMAELAPEDEVLAPHALWQVLLSTPELADYGVPAVVDTMLIDLRGLAEREMYQHVESPAFLASLGMSPALGTANWMVEEIRRMPSTPEGFSADGSVVCLEPFEVDEADEILSGLIQHDEIRESLDELLSYD